LALQTLRVRRLGGDRAGEIRLTRFLRNAAVTPQEMAAQAAMGTSRRCQGRDVLVIQDTTVVRSQGGGGDYLHAVMALDARDGAILGLVDGQFLRRAAGRKAQRRSLPVEEKESFRWLQAADQAASVCAGARRVTVVSDREGDIYEAFALRPDGVELVVRAAQDRSLDDEGRLFAALDALPEAGRADLDLPAQPGRKARTTQLAVRFAVLPLAKPARGFGKALPDAIQVQCLDVREVCPPPGASVVHWRLLTTRPIEDAAQAWAVVDLYRKRWAIEQLFRTLKTQGFDIEGLRIEEPAPRDNLLMAALIAAVVVQQMVHARDGGPGPLRPCTDAFDPEDLPLLEAFCEKLQGKTERQKNPHPKGSLAYAAWVCARLGGWTGYYGKPGPVVMLQGWLQIQAAKRTLTILTSQPNV
jgi:Transposase DDE domain